MSVATSNLVTNSSLMLYFMKKVVVNKDGSSDLLTVVTIANNTVNKILILSILKKIIEKYVSFKAEIEADNPTTDQLRSKLGKFKPFMNQIIKFEEMNFDTNNQQYIYGSSSLRRVDEESSLLHDGNVINPNQLILANEEASEVRQLMLDNINKLINRGDKINYLVDQTDRLNTSSLLFQKKALMIKRTMWAQKWKLIIVLCGGAILVFYLLIGFEC